MNSQSLNRQTKQLDDVEGRGPATRRRNMASLGRQALIASQCFTTSHKVVDRLLQPPPRVTAWHQTIERSSKPCGGLVAPIVIMVIVTTDSLVHGTAPLNHERYSTGEIGTNACLGCASTTPRREVPLGAKLYTSNQSLLDLSKFLGL